MSQQAPQRNDDQNILAIAILFGIVIVLLFLVFMNQPVPQAAPTPTPQPTEVAQVVEPTPEVTAEPAATYSEESVANGQRIFSGLCFACHGQGGVGVTGLGKPLVDSEFVNGQSDDELLHFIIEGRQPTDPLNTTGQLMPARGGNPALSDDDLRDVVAYLRSLNGATVGAAVAAPAATPAPAEGAATEPPAGGQTVAYTQQQVADGQRVFGGICFACHGLGGVGITGLGKPLVNSEFVNGQTDDELLHMIITGRQPTDPLNTTGQLMPARGGNPSLSDDDLRNVVAYIRSLNGAPIEGASAPAEGGASAPAEVRRPTAPEDWVAPPINALDASVVASGIQNTGQIDPIAGEDGAALYAWYCQSCHGPAGAGVDGAAMLAGMGMDYEAFASALTTPAPLTAPASNVFVHPLRGGSPGMSDAQIAALIGYLQGLDG